MTSAASPNASAGGRTARLRATRTRRWTVAAAVGLVLLAAAAWVVRDRLAPVLPIPVPSGLARLDPMVREHLTQVATAVSRAPRDAEARCELGLAFAVNGLWQEARQCFLDAVRLGSPSPLPRLHAAAALQEAGQVDEARRELEESVRQHPRHAPTWQRLGTLRGATGDWAGAEEANQRAAEFAPQAWQAWAGVGEARLRQNRASAAIEPLQRAVSLDPMARSARHLLGQALRAAGRAEEGERMLRTARPEAIGPLPDEWSIRAEQHMKTLPDVFERADALLARGGATAAAALLRDALRHHPGNAAVLSRLAAALRGSGQAGLAWELLQPHLRQSSNDVTLAVAAIHAAAAMERGDWGAPWADRALALAPQSAEVRVAIADLALAAGDDERAVAALREAVDRAPADAGLWVQLGEVLQLNLSRPAEARECFERALKVDALHPVALERLAALALQAGDLATAEASLAQLEELGAGSESVPELRRALERARRGAP